MTRTIDQMIASEVLCCMSSLVTTLANATGAISARMGSGAQLFDLTEQAADLAAPVDDWEEAAIQAGATEDDLLFRDNSAGSFVSPIAEAARLWCKEHDINEPYAREIFEHWAVTDWFADKLEAAGEKVDRDFAGLNIWGRTTTGQSMTMDGVVQRVYAQTHTGLEG